MLPRPADEEPQTPTLSRRERVLKERARGPGFEEGSALRRKESGSEGTRGESDEKED
jgi:hypothetical protein